MNEFRRSPKENGRRWRARGSCLAILTTLAALVLAGCSGSDSGSDKGNSEAKAGGKLTLGTPFALASFDPYNSIASNFIMYDTLYSHLINYDNDMKPHPDLASEWKIADDKKSVTIKLRKTDFGDGTPVTSADVVFGIKRAQSPETGLSLYGLGALIDSGTAVDPQTVRVDFKQPVAEDVILDWMYTFPVVKASENTIAKLQKAPAGSGPFVLASYSPGSTLVLKKNPHYYDPTRPYLDSVTFRFFDDSNALAAAVQSNDVDGAVNLDAKFKSQMKGRFDVIEGAEGALENMFYLNPTMPPFDNKACRQAVARAIDRDKIIKTVKSGVGDPLPGPYAPNSPGYDKSLLESHGFDLDAAKSGIAASCSAKTATATVQPTPEIAPTMQIIQADLKKAGFDLKIKAVDQATFVSSFRNGDLQVAISATATPFRSASAVAFSGPLGTGDRNFLWRGKVPQAYADAIHSAQTALNSEATAKANAEINKAYADLAWATGIFNRVDLFVMNKKVHDFEFNPGNFTVLTNTYVG